jgi:RpiB/LacA/LacB family sugar-phosphate isomerase
VRRVITEADIPQIGEFRIASESIITPSTHGPAQTVALGSDHVREEKPADCPDIARDVAEIVARVEAASGVIIDGAGIGSAIAANKLPGIRAALCYDKASIRNSREHNDSNVLTLGGRLLTASLAEDVWLTTPFAGEGHTASLPAQGKGATCQKPATL